MVTDTWYDTVDQLENLDEIYSVATEAKQARSACDWILGELAIKATRADVSDGATTSLKHFAGSVNESYGKIKDAAMVVKNVSREMRSEFLTLDYGHWREIVKRCSSGQDIRFWAEKAEDEGLTVGKLREQLTGEKEVSYESIMKRICKDLAVISGNISTAEKEDLGGMGGLEEAIRAFRSAREAVGGL